MKLFSSASIALAAVSAHQVARVGRSTGQVFKLNGYETSDQLMQIIMEIAGDKRDDVDEAIQAFMGVDRNLDEIQVRKFRGLKMLVLHLLQDKSFGKFCYYGCYCLPEGSHNIAKGGYGRPVDNIDRACANFKRCYKCLIDEHQGDPFVTNQFNMGYIPQEKCAGEDLGYSRTLDFDSDGKAQISCDNPAGSCRRNICECDKQLALAFATFEDEWDEQYHSVKGGFDREAKCEKRLGGSQFEYCCGDRSTFPYNEPKHADQCCEGPEARPAGTCESETPPITATPEPETVTYSEYYSYQK